MVSIEWNFPQFGYLIERIVEHVPFNSLPQLEYFGIRCTSDIDAGYNVAVALHICSIVRPAGLNHSDVSVCTFPCPEYSKDFDKCVIQELRKVSAPANVIDIVFGNSNMEYSQKLPTGLKLVGHRSKHYKGHDGSDIAFLDSGTRMQDNGDD